MKCLVLSNDLMFGSQAAQAARDAGYQVQTIDRVGLVSDLPLEPLQLVLVDLNTPGFDAREAADRWRSAVGSGPELVAVGPHVHVAKLEAARTAGWRVYTRGQFHAAAARILAPPSSP